jgi:hypothetical protein
MRKLLAIAGAVLVVALVLLWRSMDDSAATPSPKPSPEPVAAVVLPKNEVVTPVQKTEEAVTAEDMTEAKPTKLDPMGDEFFYRFTERVPKILTAQAVECYDKRTGTLHRNAKLVLTFNVRVRSGKATVTDVKIKPPDDDDPDQQNNTLHDPALESCFIQKIARTSWTDDELPDYDWPDELVLRPERGMKGYWTENRKYEGGEAPKRDRSIHAKPPALPPNPQ